jgi:HTH-type transcriptional regulator, cell division transcriptional repressor
MSDEIYAEHVATVGDRLTAAREAARMSVDALALELGVRPETLEGWEADQAEPTAPLLSQIAARLAVDADWLLTGAGTGPQQPAPAAAQSELHELRRLLAEASRQLGRLEEALKHG